jgi:hypothetical protein
MVVPEEKAGVSRMKRQSVLKLTRFEGAVPRHVLKRISGGVAQTMTDDGSSSGLAMAAVTDSIGDAHNGASDYPPAPVCVDVAIENIAFENSDVDSKAFESVGDA